MLYQITHRTTHATIFALELNDAVRDNRKMAVTVRAAITLGVSLAHAQISGANLSGIDFTGVDLSGANMRYCDISKANFKDANLSGANMQYVVAIGTNFRSANLKGADLSGAGLSGASISHADVAGAIFSGANMQNCFLNLALNLRDANIAGANFAGIELSNHNGRMTNVNLANTNLTDIKNDFFTILSGATEEILALRTALVDGRVDGCVYEGECACLIGTIANMRNVSYKSLKGILKPHPSRPAEKWFLGINLFDTPETNQISRITVGWIDEYVAAM